jgi:hypothetical protein
MRAVFWVDRRGVFGTPLEGEVSSNEAAGLVLDPEAGLVLDAEGVPLLDPEALRLLYSETDLVFKPKPVAF